ncbi:shikimate dehydrogenase family protein [Pontibacter sp. 13R65]|uniref:shikimate dehydrogenase family protein n=1 Tax=Pontibacter sp. 13R65 TaxID=3127458 RepID=UPI00301C58B6
MSRNPAGFQVNLNIQTKFLLSTSGSQSSIEKHNKALQQIKANLVYFTLADDITPEVYAGLLKSPMVRGAAVTGKGGLKSTIIPYLDEVEPLAKKTLAVNTVVNKAGKLYGYNTDAFGLKTALQNGIAEAGYEIRTAVIYGNGGVSGVAYHVLRELGIQATFVGRSQERVMQKRRELGLEHIAHFKGPYDLVVDATPISSDPDFLQAAHFADILAGCKMVFCHNMPEKDNKTNYLQQYCADHHLYYVPGKWMYNAQLVKQYQLYLDGYTKADDGTTPVSENDILSAWDLY